MTGNGDSTLGPPQVLDANRRPGSISVAGVNGDGAQDLVLANGFVTMLGNSDGTFRAGVDFPAGGGSSSVLVIDVDGDGKLDVVSGNNGSVAVLLGNGDGVFQEPLIIPSDPATQLVAVADSDGDGKVDLATVDSRSLAFDAFIIWHGNGDGTFNRGLSFGIGLDYNSVVVGDFNGDRKPDLAVANDGTS
jgi:hypothetical protein